MRYGFVIPGGSAQQQLELAGMAEASGWDGVFVWEGPYGVDAWGLLSAMAVRTERVMLGTMLTPLPWRRPWKVASQAATLQELSSGRAIVAVGLGAVDTGLGVTGEETDRRVRAERLDEGIEIMRGLWRGGDEFTGAHYRVDLRPRAAIGLGVDPLDRPPRLWVVGAWPRPKSMRRAAGVDGLLPTCMTDEGEHHQPSPDELRAICAWLAEHGPVPSDYDVVIEGETAPGRDADIEQVAACAAAGATWWLEAAWMIQGSPEERHRALGQRLRAGPPVA